MKLCHLPATLALSLLAVSVSAALYVSPEGGDGWTGKLAEPNASTGIRQLGMYGWPADRCELHGQLKVRTDLGQLPARALTNSATVRTNFWDRLLGYLP